MAFSISALPFGGEKYAGKSHWPILLSLLIFQSHKTHTNEAQSCPFQLLNTCILNMFISFNVPMRYLYDINFLFLLILITWNCL